MKWILFTAASAICMLVSFTSAGDKSKPLRVCLVSGSLEYDSDGSLTKFQKHFEKHYVAECSRAFIKTESDLPGLDNLDTCDVVLLFTRRLKITGEQLERVKKYCTSGKPIVGIRTASHAFQNWLDFDKEVLGGNYKGHYKDGPLCEVRLPDDQFKHPILKGVQAFKSEGSLYKNTGLAKDVQILLTGSIPEHEEPIAWTRNYKGGRIFYTSLGHQQDFDDPNFNTLIANALYWTAQREPVVRKAP